jgi:segregation and condensation protein A
MNSEQDYRVNLENFGGPLDLLLHLVRKEEVDIHDIPISKILDQYMKHLEAIHALDLDDAGDFLVMAATLMLIKSKMLLPTEDVDLEEEIDPRYELVQ